MSKLDDILAAIAKDDDKELKRILENPGNPDTLSCLQTISVGYIRLDGQHFQVQANLLFYAIQGGHKEVIKYLLSRPEAQQLISAQFTCPYIYTADTKSTLLHLAIETKDLETVKLICRPALGVDVNYHSDGKFFEEACHQGAPLATAIR